MLGAARTPLMSFLSCLDEFGFKGGVFNRFCKELKRKNRKYDVYQRHIRNFSKEKKV